MTLRLCLVICIWIALCTGAEILLRCVSGGPMNALYRHACAMECARDDACAGISLTGTTCALHLRLEPRAHCIRQFCPSEVTRFPPGPIEEVGIPDVGAHILVFATPIPFYTAITKVHFYAANVAPLWLQISDGSDNKPNRITVRKTIEITNITLGYNSISLGNVNVAAGQFASLYWSGAGVVRKVEKVGEPVAFKEGLSLPADGDTVRMDYHVLHTYQFRLQFACPCDTCL